MRLITMILAGAIVVGLVVGGVVEIKFHPEEITSVPSRLFGAATDGAVREKVRSQGVTWKRAGEQWLIKDEAKKLQLAIGYVEADADRVLELAETGKDSADTILPQAELLISSIERSSILTDTVAVEVLAEARVKTREALLTASNALAKLQELKTDLFALNEKFAAVTEELEQQVGDVRLADDPNKEGAVAGTTDEEAATSAEEEIPLDF